MIDLGVLAKLHGGDAVSRAFSSDEIRLVRGFISNFSVDLARCTANFSIFIDAYPLSPPKRWPSAGSIVCFKLGCTFRKSAFKTLIETFETSPYLNFEIDSLAVDSDSFQLMTQSFEFAAELVMCSVGKLNPLGDGHRIESVGKTFGAIE